MGGAMILTRLVLILGCQHCPWWRHTGVGNWREKKIPIFAIWFTEVERYKTPLSFQKFASKLKAQGVCLRYPAVANRAQSRRGGNIAIYCNVSQYIAILQRGQYCNPDCAFDSTPTNPSTRWGVELRPDRDLSFVGKTLAAMRLNHRSTPMRTLDNSVIGLSPTVKC